MKGQFPALKISLGGRGCSVGQFPSLESQISAGEDTLKGHFLIVKISLALCLKAGEQGCFERLIPFRESQILANKDIGGALLFALNANSRRTRNLKHELNLEGNQKLR